MENIPVICRSCGEKNDVPVNMDAYNQWKDGEALIQDALPELSAAQRELLMSGTCGKCWDLMFGPSEEDEDEAESVVSPPPLEVPEDQAVQTLCDWIKEGADLDDLAKLFSVVMTSAGVVVKGNCGSLSDTFVEGERV